MKRPMPFTPYLFATIIPSVILAIALMLTGCASQGYWKRTIVQNRLLGWQSVDDRWQIENQGPPPTIFLNGAYYCLREHVPGTTLWSDCVMIDADLTAVMREASRLTNGGPCKGVTGSFYAVQPKVMPDGCIQRAWWDKDHSLECECPRP